MTVGTVRYLGVVGNLRTLEWSKREMLEALYAR